MATITRKLNSSTTKHLRRLLEGKLAELRARMMISTANSALYADEDIYDWADLAERSHEAWLWVKKNSFDVALLREVEDALERLREKSYGTCMDCARPVARKRLEAVPWTRYCVSCQERHNPSPN